MNLGRTVIKIIIAILVPLSLISCVKQPNSREKLEFLAKAELCTDAKVTETLTESNDAPVRFDVIYQFEVVASQQCLARFEGRINRVHQCRRYPNQLSCDVEGGDTLILNQVDTGMSITYFT